MIAPLTTRSFAVVQKENPVADSCKTNPPRGFYFQAKKRRDKLELVTPQALEMSQCSKTIATDREKLSQNPLNKTREKGGAMKPSQAIAEIATFLA